MTFCIPAFWDDPYSQLSGISLHCSSSVFKCRIFRELSTFSLKMSIKYSLKFKFCIFLKAFTETLLVGMGVAEYWCLAAGFLQVIELWTSNHQIFK